MESPGTLTGYAGKSRELTLARQRGGRGMALSLTHYRRMEFSLQVLQHLAEGHQSLAAAFFDFEGLQESAA